MKPRIPTSRNTAPTAMAAVRTVFPRSVSPTPMRSLVVMTLFSPLVRSGMLQVRPPYPPALAAFETPAVCGRVDRARMGVTAKTPDTSEGRHAGATDNLDERAPDSPTELSKPSLKYVLRKTLREFSKDECTDLAAALTYYAVLSLFPDAIALLSLVGLVGQGPQTVKTLMDILDQIGAGSATQTLGKTLTSLANAPQAAGFAFVIGLATALWSASGYVGAFGRAMNRMYEVREGRPIWKLRPVMLLVTLISLILAAVVAMALVLTGPAAKAVGDAIGL